jgi:hypothetical protein
MHFNIIEIYQYVGLIIFAILFLYMFAYGARAPKSMMKYWRAHILRHVFFVALVALVAGFLVNFSEHGVISGIRISAIYSGLTTFCFLFFAMISSLTRKL